MTEIAVRSEELTPEQRETFLDVIRENPGIGTRAALARAGVMQESVHERGNGAPAWVRKVPLSKDAAKALIESDPELFDDYLAARGKHPEQLVSEAVRRAVHGVDKPVYQNGMQVGEIREYSDRLLGMLLKAYVPEFRDSARLEVTGDGGGPIETQQGVSLVAVLGVLRDAGVALDGNSIGPAREALPAARPVLAEPVPED